MQFPPHPPWFILAKLKMLAFMKIQSENFLNLT